MRAALIRKESTVRDILKKHKIDIIVISAILLVIAISLTLLFAVRREGGAVRVTVGGEVVGEYPLNKNATYEFKSKGDGGEETVTNVLVVENGVAYMTYALCPDHTCINSGKIKYVGQRITCLPNKLSAVIVGKDSDVDLVS